MVVPCMVTVGVKQTDAIAGSFGVTESMAFRRAGWAPNASLGLGQELCSAL